MTLSRSEQDRQTALAEKRVRLKRALEGWGPVVVAYSGGVDSALVMSVAHSLPGSRALAVTASSPSVAPEELEGAVELAAQRGWRHRVISTREMADERYVANDGRRCFFCKSELYTHLVRLAKDEGFSCVANGTNADDLGDYRPGLKAAEDFAVISPLVDAGITKQDVRELAREDGLPVWDKPAQPCLASRIPYGTAVSVAALRQIAVAERALRGLGFKVVRVRHYGETARVELPLEDLPRFNSPRVFAEAERQVLAAGYSSLELDEKGFRSGNLNEALARR